MRCSRKSSNLPAMQLRRSSAVSTRSDASTAPRLALPALRQIATSLEHLPKEASLNRVVRRAGKVGRNSWIAPFGDAAAVDVLAWQCIVAHFAALERVDTWLGQPSRNLSRREMLATLVDVAANESLPPAHDDVGRVRVLPAPAARTIVARHLFLAGMSEQNFPSGEQPGRLATDSDYRFFARAADQKDSGAATSSASTRAQDEMLLFYEVVSRAEKSLTISYPALDDKAQELPPSPYVHEIERIFRRGGKNGIRCSSPQLSPMTSEQPCSLADWRTGAVSTAFGRDREVRRIGRSDGV